MHRVVVLALPGVIPFELSLPVRILGTARSAAGDPLYEVITCTLDGQPVVTDADFAICVDYDASILATAETVVIPAAENFAEITGFDTLPAGLAAAISAIRPNTRIVSICLGSYVLAALGLLDRRPATTHWLHADRFRRRFPSVQVAPEVLFVDDGDILTSAGAAAGVDLCLHLIRRDHGSQVANHVARRCVVPPWREGGQAQYIEWPVPVLSAVGTSPTRQWALGRLGRRLEIADLAEHAKMSRRTFTRRFREEVGTSPGRWITQQRVELARQLLETSDLSIEQVAHRAGFGTAASLRLHVAAALGVSPRDYRRGFNHPDPQAA
jgi:transcriptional regulator GlxA family with amidase domain